MTTDEVGDIKNLVNALPGGVHPKEDTSQKRKNEKHDFDVFEMVMSIGWNPFYKNTKRSIVINTSFPLLSPPPPSG